MQNRPLGIVEVLGSANAVLAADQMLKTAQVELATWDYRCGGHVCIFIRGDVSAVQAAVDSMKTNPPCNVIMAGVISSPSDDTNRIINERIKRFTPDHFN